MIPCHAGTADVLAGRFGRNQKNDSVHRFRIEPQTGWDSAEIARMLAGEEGKDTRHEPMRQKADGVFAI